MRQLVIGAATLLCVGAALSAQTTLLLGQPLNSANNGNPNGGIYFNMTVTQTLTWTNLRYVASDASTTGQSSVNIYIGPNQWQGNVGSTSGWTLIGQTAPVACTNGTDTIIDGVVSAAGANPGTVTFAPGTYGIALEAVTHSWGYQNGQFIFSNADLSIDAGGASNTFLTLPTFSPRTINGELTYTLGGTPMTFAARQNYGEGCYARYQSFYEVFANTSTGHDFSNTSLRMTLNQAGPEPFYDISTGTAQVQPQGPNAVVQTFADNNASVQVPLNQVPFIYAKDGAISTVLFDPTAQDFVVEMGADGFVTLEGTNAGGNPSVANFLGGMPRVGNLHDMDPLVGGTAWYELDLNNGAHLFTWDAIPSRANAGLNTFQIALFFTGDIELRWGAMNLTVGGGWPTLVGFTPGGTSLDPGTIDITAAAPFSTQPTDSDPLLLEANVNPVINTTVNLTTSNDSVPGIGVCFISFSEITPPFDLGIIGAPGCFANIDINQGAGFAIDNLGISGMTLAFPIPNQTNVIGQSFYCQSIMLDAAANALGLTASNGTRLLVGAF